MRIVRVEIPMMREILEMKWNYNNKDQIVKVTSELIEYERVGHPSVCGHNEEPKRDLTRAMMVERTKCPLGNPIFSIEPWTKATRT